MQINDKSRKGIDSFGAFSLENLWQFGRHVVTNLYICSGD